MISENFFKALKSRRTYYSISCASPVSDDKIIQVVHEAVKHTPSAFNSQNSRVIILLGDHHKQLWNLIEDTLKGMIPEDKFAPTAEKMESFRAGYGSVLFFEEMQTVESLQNQFPLYKDNFPLWSQQASGMLQHAVWVALELEGFGASLQHYNPLINEAVAKEWDVPANWRLVSQMPFGTPTAKPGPKDFMPLEERVKIFK